MVEPGLHIESPRGPWFKSGQHLINFFNLDQGPFQELFLALQNYTAIIKRWIKTKPPHYISILVKILIYCHFTWRQLSVTNKKKYIHTVKLHCEYKKSGFQNELLGKRKQQKKFDAFFWSVI